MSLATRCPACDTTFKVVRDQLRISDGWVRCGRCSQVFDATVDLQESTDVQPTAPVPPSDPAPATDEAHSQAEPEPESEPEPDAAPATEAADDSRQDLAETDFLDEESGPVPLTDAPPALAVAWPDPDSLLLGDHGRTAVRPPAPPPLAFPDIDLSLPPTRPALTASEAPAPEFDDSGHAQLQKALRRARVKAAKVAKARAKEQGAAQAEVTPVVLAASEAEQPPTGPALPVVPAPGFLGGDEAPSWWHRPSARRSLVVAAVLMVLLLIAQVLHHERDLVAARQPALRPLLENMCRLTGCELSALRQINDIKIDGASFARDKNGEGFQLSFTVRNVAAVPLAMPSVELSLLDTQERAVVRRVLMPPDFAAPAVLPARAERSASLSLKLGGADAASMPPVAGFRIEALYP